MIILQEAIGSFPYATPSPAQRSLSRLRLSVALLPLSRRLAVRRLPYPRLGRHWDTSQHAQQFERDPPQCGQARSGPMKSEQHRDPLHAHLWADRLRYLFTDCCTAAHLLSNAHQLTWSPSVGKWVQKRLA